MARTLKVYRTSTGFHDAYVAAASRAAALRAWGSDNDLFARGAAEEVEDPKLTAEPLAHPGQVIRKSRGSLADQLAALPEDRPARKTAEPAEEEDAPKSKTAKAKAPRPRPRPSRAKLDSAEAAAEALDTGQKAALNALTEREAALRKERRDLEAEQQAARDRAARAIEKARAAYDAAIDRWRSED